MCTGPSLPSAEPWAGSVLVCDVSASGMHLQGVSTQSLFLSYTKWENGSSLLVKTSLGMFGFQIRSMPCYIKELRSLCTSLGTHPALPPLAECAIDFFSKAKVTSVPPELPAELERKEELLQNQNVFSEEIHSPRHLMKKMKMFQGLQYKPENFMILSQHFLILGVYKKPQRYLKRDAPVSSYQILATQ